MNVANVDVPLAHVVKGQSFAAVAGQYRRVQGAHTSMQAAGSPSLPQRSEIERPKVVGSRVHPQLHAEAAPQRLAAQNFRAQPQQYVMPQDVPRSDVKQMVTEIVKDQLKPLLTLLESVVSMLKITVSERVLAGTLQLRETGANASRDDQPIVADHPRRTQEQPTEPRAKQNQNAINLDDVRSKQDRVRNEARSRVGQAGDRHNAIRVSRSPDSHREKPVSKATEDRRRISALTAELEALKKAFEETTHNND